MTKEPKRTETFNLSASWWRRKGSTVSRLNFFLGIFVVEEIYNIFALRNVSVILSISFYFIKFVTKLQEQIYMQRDKQLT